MRMKVAAGAVFFTASLLLSACGASGDKAPAAATQLQFGPLSESQVLSAPVPPECSDRHANLINGENNDLLGPAKSVSIKGLTDNSWKKNSVIPFTDSETEDKYVAILMECEGGKSTKESYVSIYNEFLGLVAVESLDERAAEGLAVHPREALEAGRSAEFKVQGLERRDEQACCYTGDATVEFTLRAGTLHANVVERPDERGQASQFFRLLRDGELGLALTLLPESKRDNTMKALHIWYSQHPDTLLEPETCRAHERSNLSFTRVCTAQTTPAGLEVSLYLQRLGYGKWIIIDAAVGGLTPEASEVTNPLNK